MKVKYLVLGILALAMVAFFGLELVRDDPPYAPGPGELAPNPSSTAVL